jgi:hypothetical protein
MQGQQPSFVSLAAKTVVCHTVTYLLIGMLAYHFLNYEQLINQPCSGMRPTTSTWVLLGPPLQLFRGVLFASVFYPFRSELFGRRSGWLLMAWMLIGIGILGTFAAPDGSLEGFIYLKNPIQYQVRGYLDIVTQAVLLSILLCYWVNHPGKRWMNWTLGTLYVISLASPALGLLAQQLLAQHR